MRKVEVVTGHPSSKVLTLKIEHDSLGHYEKIAIPRSSALVAHSPFAQVLFGRGKDVNRVDFFAKDGHTFVSIARKLMAWDDVSSAAAKAVTESFLTSRHKIIYINALDTNFKTHPAFNPGGNPVKKLVQTTFIQQVNPLLAKDGGAMELLDVEIKPTGEISSSVALLGSCNGCTSAEDTTLQAAAERIKLVLEAIKKNNPSNQSIAALNFTGINIRNMDEIILSKS